MDAVDQYKLHAQIWEKEIDLLESLSSSLVNFMEPREGISSLFTGLDKDLENLLCCQIKPKPNGRCKYQQLYLKKLYTCLGVDQFRSFLGQFHVVVMSFIRPLMSHIVERNFVDATPINEWSKLSTLAFGIIFWLNTQPSSQGPDLYVDLVALSDTIEAALGSEWTDNRARNMVELKKAFEGFNQMVVGEAISIVGLLDEDSLMDDCKTCWPTDDKSIADRRLKRTELIFKLPKDKILTLMPSFTRNICTPPIEANPKNLLCFIAERNCNSSKKMSRQLMHDKEIVKEWSRLFIESELSKEPSLRLSVPQLKCLQSLLATPEMSVAWYNADSIVWRLFSERSDWFIEKYREIYPVLPKRAIMACIERTPLIVMQTGTIFFLAILRVRDELSEEDLFEIIQLAMRRSFVKNFYVAPSSGALLTDIIVLFQLLISKIACSEILTSKLEANCLIGEPLFTMKIMEECVFRFITPTTPEKRLESALVLVEVSQRYEPAEKKAMRLRVIKMLKKLVQSGHHKELCSKALKKLMTKPNTLPAKKKTKTTNDKTIDVNKPGPSN